MAHSFCLALGLLILVSVPPTAGDHTPANKEGEWPSYGHDLGGTRFSPLTGINKSNVAGLKVAWTFRTGDAYQPPHSKPTAFEATPLYVDGSLFLSTPLGRAMALDPVSGRSRWSYDARIERDKGYGDYSNRGVSSWVSKSGKRRIFLATIDARMVALDSVTGLPCQDFGDNGTINLRQNLRIPPQGFADYEETSPPAVVGNTIVVGSAVADNGSTEQASGEVRGFDAQSGKLKWTWDPIPQNSRLPGADSWKSDSAKKTGAANAWSIIVADPERGLVFVPTGSASPDYYGGERPGDNLFANSVVALQAETGAMVWHFQTVHHDLWDYDVAAPPVLFDFEREGQTIPAIAIGSKTANLFFLNRETGKPIFDIQERPVPQSDVAGETTSRTQPFAVKPAPISSQKMTAADAWGVDEADRTWCRNELSGLRAEGVFTPPSLQGSLMMPGHIGGMAWGGAAYDPLHRLLVLPTNHLAAEVRLIPRDKYQGARESDRKLNGDWEFAAQAGTPYGMMRRLLVSPKRRIPCTPPPWGTLLAIDTRTGNKEWEVPLGKLFAQAKPEWGSIALGGPIVTAGGLVFMAGTLDTALYAFDVQTGKQLWHGELPTSARATPMTLQGPDGKQYVVISAGSHQPAGKAPLGDYVVAFSL